MDVHAYARLDFRILGRRRENLSNIVYIFHPCFILPQFRVSVKYIQKISDYIHGT
jgi:hypothetical protein